MTEKKKKSVLLYIGIGCGALILLAILVAVIMGVLVSRWAKQVQTDIEDPLARTVKTSQILGCDALPAGYHAMLGITVPFISDIAVLSDSVCNEVEREKKNKNKSLHLASLRIEKDA